MKLPVVAWPRFSALIAALLMGVMLASCSTSPRPKPKDLGPVATIEAKLRWQTNTRKKQENKGPEAQRIRSKQTWGMLGSGYG